MIKHLKRCQLVTIKIIFSLIELLISAVIMEVCVLFELYITYLKFLDFFSNNINCSSNDFTLTISFESMEFQI